MVFDRDSKSAFDGLKAEHAKQAEQYVNEVVAKATQETSQAPAKKQTRQGREGPLFSLDKLKDLDADFEIANNQMRASSAGGDLATSGGFKPPTQQRNGLLSKPPAYYLAKAQTHQIRARTQTPELVRQLKLAKHLRRKKRFSEAEDCERKARMIDLADAKKLVDSTKQMATGRRLRNLVLHQESAMNALKRRMDSKAYTLEKRHERERQSASDNLKAEVSRVSKQCRNGTHHALKPRPATDESLGDDALSHAKQDLPRAPSAPAKAQGRNSSQQRPPMPGRKQR